VHSDDLGHLAGAFSSQFLGLPRHVTPTVDDSLQAVVALRQDDKTCFITKRLSWAISQEELDQTLPLDGLNKQPLQQIGLEMVLSNEIPMLHPPLIGHPWLLSWKLCSIQG
jgi:hypothetical protein